MSSSAEAALNARRDGDEGPPFVGALLRLCVRRIRTRIDAAIRAAGFADLHETHLGVFSCPVPDGVRPSELARHLHKTRQTTNYVITQMEALGYLERRPIEGGDRRLVYLTPRGWAVVETICACSREVQAEWSQEIGPERFRDLVRTLRLLAGAEPRRPGSAR